MDLVEPEPTPVSADVPSRDIVGEGTSEARWMEWLSARSIEVVSIDRWLSPQARLVVVSPHPDDEILACGGMLAMHAERGGRCLIIGVTDGDASHLGSASWTRLQLAAARRDESALGMQRLGLRSGSPHVDVRRLGLPDGAVTANVDIIETRVGAMLDRDDVVVTTWRHDGHPDHEATGRATARACANVGARLLEAPVWMWHWSVPGDERVPWTRLRAVPVGEEPLRRKQHALQAHVTQLTPRDQVAAGPKEPVLGAAILERSVRPFEYFIVPQCAATVPRTGSPS